MKTEMSSRNVGVYSQVEINFPFEWHAAFTLNKS